MAMEAKTFFEIDSKRLPCDAKSSASCLEQFRKLLREQQDIPLTKAEARKYVKQYPSGGNTILYFDEETYNADNFRSVTEAEVSEHERALPEERAPKGEAQMVARSFLFRKAQALPKGDPKIAELELRSNLEYGPMSGEEQQAWDALLRQKDLRPLPRTQEEAEVLNQREREALFRDAKNGSTDIEDAALEALLRGPLPPQEDAAWARLLRDRGARSLDALRLEAEELAEEEEDEDREGLAEETTNREARKGFVRLVHRSRRHIHPTSVVEGDGGSLVAQLVLSRRCMTVFCDTLNVKPFFDAWKAERSPDMWLAYAYVFLSLDGKLDEVPELDNWPDIVGDSIVDALPEGALNAIEILLRGDVSYDVEDLSCQVDDSFAVFYRFQLTDRFNPGGPDAPLLPAQEFDAGPLPKAKPPAKPATSKTVTEPQVKKRVTPTLVRPGPASFESAPPLTREEHWRTQRKPFPRRITPELTRPGAAPGPLPPHFGEPQRPMHPGPPAPVRRRPDEPAPQPHMQKEEERTAEAVRRHLGLIAAQQDDDVTQVDEESPLPRYVREVHTGEEKSACTVLEPRPAASGRAFSWPGLEVRERHLYATKTLEKNLCVPILGELITPVQHEERRRRRADEFIYDNGAGRIVDARPTFYPDESGIGARGLAIAMWARQPTTRKQTVNAVFIDNSLVLTSRVNKNQEIRAHRTWKEGKLLGKAFAGSVPVQGKLDRYIEAMDNYIERVVAQNL